MVVVILVVVVAVIVVNVIVVNVIVVSVFVVQMWSLWPFFVILVNCGDDAASASFDSLKQ